jgi:acetyltransferase
LLFEPASVAVFGASDRAGSVGATVWRNLSEGSGQPGELRYSGRLYAVNPRRPVLGGQPAWPDVAALPEAPDLAVVCTPPATVAGLVAELGARGTRAAVVLTAGFSPAQKTQMLQAAQRHGLRILGPNCLGLLNPLTGLNASFAHRSAVPGTLAFVSQSGALVTGLLDWAAGRGFGFSRFVSLGESADVDFADLLDHLANDARTTAILLYVESIANARKFMSAARAAARNKPVLVVKAGRSAVGAQAAASHTGALAASDLVFDAAIRRAGLLRVNTLEELFTAAQALAHHRTAPVATLDEAPVPGAEQLLLLTNGGGAGVLAADAAEAQGLTLAPLDSATQRALDAVLPANWSHGNPVDIIGDAPVARYVGAVQALATAPGTLLFMHAPTAIVPSAAIAQALVPAFQALPQPPLSVWLGDAAVRDARALFAAAGLPCFDTPEQAVRAFGMRVQYAHNQRELLQTPPAAALPAFDAAAVAAPIAAALAEGREWLNEPEAKALLAAIGVPVAATRTAAPTPEAAVAAAQAIGFPVVMKIVSPQITHKSDVGGVALNLDSPEAVHQAARDMLARVQQARPDAVLQGLALQAMVRRPRALELIVGAATDPLFGPVLLFGAGGTAVEVLADRAVGLPPLNAPLARALVARTRISRLLAGWRDVPAADVESVCRVLCAVSQLLAEEPRITELDINPLLADAAGVVALDARVRVSAAAPGGAAHFAIQPYPTALVETLAWQGRRLTLRPIRPEDEAQHLAFLARLSPEDIRLRVFHTRRHIGHGELARLTQIDYSREMAFIATAPGPDGDEETLGVVRSATDTDNRSAEFAVVVRSDLHGGGLGERLMHKLIAYQRSRGTAQLVGRVLADNPRMLTLATALGFSATEDAEDPGVLRLVLPLAQPGG